jgi:hypothetical protein
MARCQLVHDLRQCPVQVGSPQTQPQRDQVTRVIKKLIAQANTLRRTVSEINVVNTETGEGAEDHSPRNPTAHAITMSLTQGHGHFPIGAPGIGLINQNVYNDNNIPNGHQSEKVYSPGGVDLGSINIAGTNTSAAISADEEDPWSVDIVQGYDDVDIDSDLEDHDNGKLSSATQANHSFRFGEQVGTTGLIDQLSQQQTNGAHESAASTADVDMVFENLREDQADDLAAGDEDNGDQEAIRGATAVDNGVSVSAPSPPGSLQPSITGGVRSYRNQK